jgi:hypothetical protein
MGAVRLICGTLQVVGPGMQIGVHILVIFGALGRLFTR